MPTHATPNAITTVDADGHLLEPRNTWIDYIEPNLRDRAIRIEKDADGVECLLVDGRSHQALRGRLGALGGIEMDSTDLMTIGSRSYEDGCPAGGYDPAANSLAEGRIRIIVIAGRCLMGQACGGGDLWDMACDHGNEIVNRTNMPIPGQATPTPPLRVEMRLAGTKSWRPSTSGRPGDAAPLPTCRRRRGPGSSGT